MASPGANACVYRWPIVLRERASPLPGSLRRALMAEPGRPSACSRKRERCPGCPLSDRTYQVVLRDT
jgi:hypothetical protein